MTFGTILIIILVGLIAAALIAGLRDTLARAYAESMEGVRAAARATDSGIAEAIRSLARVSRETVRGLMPSAPAGQAASAAPFLLFAVVLTIFWLLATAADVPTTIARLAGVLGGSGSVVSNGTFELLVGLVYVATLGLYACIWADLDGVCGRPVLWAHKPQEIREHRARVFLAGAGVMVLSALFMVIAATSAAAGNSDPITQDLFWITFFAGAYGAIFLGGLGLISLFGALWAALLRLLIAPLFAARLVLRAIFALVMVVLWVLKVTAIDILGTVAARILEPLRRGHTALHPEALHVLAAGPAPIINITARTQQHPGGESSTAV